MLMCSLTSQRVILMLISIRVPYITHHDAGQAPHRPTTVPPHSSNPPSSNSLGARHASQRHVKTAADALAAQDTPSVRPPAATVLYNHHTPGGPPCAEFPPPLDVCRIASIQLSFLRRLPQLSYQINADIVIASHAL